jgi:hypothetical protein
MAGVEAKTWEQLEGASGFVIDAVLAEIARADLVAFDVTELNENVMFELGYTIGARRAIWLVRDPSFPEAERQWKQMRTLTTVRYAPYTNSDEIRIAFLTDRPDLQRHIIFDESIGPVLQPEEGPSLFYLRSFYDTDAARAITRRVHAETPNGIQVIQADPRESSFEGLAWYAQQIYASSAVVIHFDDPRRAEGLVHNSRLALVAGLAHGMGKPMLMLAQQEYLAPIDYRDLLYVYGNPALAASKTDEWLRDKLADARERQQDVERRTSRLRLATELRSLRFGQHVAENESDVLGEYFVRTAAYENVLTSRTTVFIGRKGTGKSANALEAAAELADDRRQLVCLIKPYEYELAAVTSLLERYSERDQKGFVVESLWKFLLYSEIALAAYREFEGRRVTGLSTEEEALVQFLDDFEPLTHDFAVRLERTIEDLLAIPESDSLADERVAISEGLHEKMIGALRRRLVGALRHKVRVAVLIDNLDRSWEHGSKSAVLAEFLLGLITAAEQIEAEVRREGGHREPLQVAVAIFLRSDIYGAIAEVAAEPDKIPLTRINWNDPDLRIQVLEERYLATRSGSPLPDELWDRYFGKTVRGVDVRTYLTWRTLPRPRDLVYLANEAIVAAINHRSPLVEERDVLAAEIEYSQFAVEALEVEAGGVLPIEPIDLFFAFAGSDAVLTETGLRTLIRDAGVDEGEVDSVIGHLRALSFLGIEIGDNRFAWVEDARELARTDVLAQRRTAGAEARFALHPAYRPYLEIEDADLPAGQLSFI